MAETETTDAEDVVEEPNHVHMETVPLRGEVRKDLKWRTKHGGVSPTMMGIAEWTLPANEDGMEYRGEVSLTYAGEIKVRFADDHESPEGWGSTPTTYFKPLDMVSTAVDSLGEGGILPDPLPVEEEGEG